MSRPTLRLLAAAAALSGCNFTPPRSAAPVAVPATYQVGGGLGEPEASERPASEAEREGGSNATQGALSNGGLDAGARAGTVEGAGVAGAVGSSAEGSAGVEEPRGALEGRRDDSGAGTLADLAWWDLFRDPVLRGLVSDALVKNQDLVAARARVDGARAAVVGATAPLLPQLGYAVEGGAGRNTFLGQFGVAGAKVTTMVAVGATANWEIDLFGAQRSRREGAEALLLATEDARRGAMLSVLGATAQAYFTVLTLDREVEISEATVLSYGEALVLFQRRLAAGWSTALATQAAEADLQSVAAKIPLLRRRLAETEHALSVLLGRDPGAVPRGLPLVEQRLPELPRAGVPAELLERRPDLREAAARLRAAQADVGAAIAGYYPSLGLTGLVGAAGLDFRDMVEKNGFAWSAFGALTGPIYTFGAVSSVEDQARSAEVAARAALGQALLRAFADVSDRLAAQRALEEALGSQRRAVAALRESVELAKQRYVAGTASYDEVLQQLELLYPAALTEAELEGALLINAAALYVALGGGWATPTADFAKPPSR